MQTYIVNQSWPVIIDKDPRELTNSEIQEVAHLMVRHTLVIFKKVKDFTIFQQAKFAWRFGDVQNSVTSDNELQNKGQWTGHKNVVRVTGGLNEHGLPGMHGGKSDLDWHCNTVWRDNRMPIVYLYAVSGSQGSRTSYTNNILAYANLDQQWKDRIEPLRMRVARNYAKYSESGDVFHIPDWENPDYHPSIHQKNHGGQDTLYFPFNQINGLYNFPQGAEQDEIVNYLIEHQLQERHVYHHDWEDGDVLIADQWSGLHKRWAFEQMDTRLLHRIAMNYSKIQF